MSSLFSFVTNMTLSIKDSESPGKESILTMLASEEILKKDWDNKPDERWDNV